MSDLPEPIPASTLVLMRERAGAPPELLMTERTGQMAFAAGALVFPGGRIDEADREAAAQFPDLDDAAARIAAIRETIEETGLAPGVAPQPPHDRIAALRDALEQGGNLASLLAQEGVSLDLDALVPFARWCPNFRETRRFDTLFYLAEAPADAAEPAAAAHEAVRAFWASAEEVLGELDAGRAHAIFPTRRNLERLARYRSFAEARADAERHPATCITPWVEQREDGYYVCIPDGIGYPITSEPLETARRR